MAKRKQTEPIVHDVENYKHIIIYTVTEKAYLGLPLFLIGSVSFRF